MSRRSLPPLPECFPSSAENRHVNDVQQPDDSLVGEQCGYSQKKELQPAAIQSNNKGKLNPPGDEDDDDNQPSPPPRRRSHINNPYAHRACIGDDCFLPSEDDVERFRADSRLAIARMVIASALAGSSARALDTARRCLRGLRDAQSELFIRYSPSLQARCGPIHAFNVACGGMSGAPPPPRCNSPPDNCYGVFCGQYFGWARPETIPNLFGLLGIPDCQIVAVLPVQPKGAVSDEVSWPPHIQPFPKFAFAIYFRHPNLVKALEFIAKEIGIHFRPDGVCLGVDRKFLSMTMERPTSSKLVSKHTVDQ